MNSPQVKTRSGPSERARASHWSAAGRVRGKIITKCNCGAKTPGTGVSSILTWLEFAGSLSPHPDLLPKGEGMRMADFGRFVRPAFQARRRQYYLSRGDLSPLGTGERNSPQVKARSGPSERARANHWPTAGRGGGRELPKVTAAPCHTFGRRQDGRSYTS